jgi:hypothetical protein
MPHLPMTNSRRLLRERVLLGMYVAVRQPESDKRVNFVNEPGGQVLARCVFALSTASLSRGRRPSAACRGYADCRRAGRPSSEALTRRGTSMAANHSAGYR